MKHCSILLTLFASFFLISCGAYSNLRKSHFENNKYPSIDSILCVFRILNECDYTDKDKYIYDFLSRSNYEFVDSGVSYKISENTGIDGKYADVREIHYFVVGLGDTERHLVDKINVKISNGLAFTRDCLIGHIYLYLYFDNQTAMTDFIKKAKRFGFKRWDQSLFYYNDREHRFILDMVIENNNCIKFSCN